MTKEELKAAKRTLQEAADILAELARDSAHQGLTESGISFSATAGRVLLCTGMVAGRIEGLEK